MATDHVAQAQRIGSVSVIDWTHIVASLLTLGVGYIVDRFGYNRKIATIAKGIAKSMPDGDAKEIANQAIIAANLAEADRVMKAHRIRQAEHEARMAAIKAGNGDVNVGSFDRSD